MRAWWWCSAVLALAGCGQPAPDLFEVQRRGADANANLRLVVSDGGTVRCNDAAPKALDADRLLRARELARQLEEPVALGLELEPGPGSVLSYRVRSPGGSVAFSDTSPQRPPVFDQVAAFTDDVAEDICGVERRVEREPPRRQRSIPQTSSATSSVNAAPATKSRVHCGDASLKETLPPAQRRR